MHQRLVGACRAGVSLAVAAAVLISVGVGAVFATDRWMPGELLVGFKAGVRPEHAEAIYMQHGASRIEELPQLNVHRIQVPAHALDAVEQALRRRPEVEFVERNGLITPQTTVDDPYYPNQWVHPKIGSPSAWDITRGDGVVIAIVDTGVDSSHPDLAANIVPGWNIYSNNSNTSDPVGHGTRTAGIAAAVGNNGVGVAGVSWGSRIMPMRAGDDTGYFSYSNVAKAVTWAVDHGARVISMSLIAHSSSTVTSAAQYAMGKGAVVVSGAGNCGCWDSSPENPYMVTVAATDQNDVVTSFSASGNFVDISAPTYNPTTAPGGGYVTMSGTSASTPVVAGVAALMMAANPGLTPADVVKRLKANADDLGPGGWDPQHGAGRVNAYRAVAEALATTTSPPAADTTKPTVSITSPSGGATVTGTVAISASASDNVGVSRVDFYADGQFLGSDTSSPFSIAWDTTTAADGQRTLVAKAYDAVGNEGVSGSVTVNVSNGSSTSGDSTGSGSTGSTDTTPPTTNVDTIWQAGPNLKFKVSASDNVGVVKVELYIDGTLRGTTTKLSDSFTVSSRTLSSGTHAAVSKAYDAAGNVGTSKSVSFTTK